MVISVFVFGIVWWSVLALWATSGTVAQLLIWAVHVLQSRIYFFLTEIKMKHTFIHDLTGNMYLQCVHFGLRFSFMKDVFPICYCIIYQRKKWNAFAQSCLRHFWSFPLMGHMLIYSYCFHSFKPQCFSAIPLFFLECVWRCTTPHYHICGFGFLVTGTTWSHLRTTHGTAPLSGQLLKWAFSQAEKTELGSFLFVEHLIFG